MRLVLMVVGGLVVWGAVTSGPDQAGPVQHFEVLPAEQPGGMGGGTVLLLLVGVLVVALVSRGARSAGGRAASGRAVAGHAHGDRALIARHEAGHVAAARAVGGRVMSATAGDREGLVQAEVPDVRASVTFLRAGRYAAGTRRGCGGDERAEQAELRDVPRGERRQLVHDADRDARRIVRQHASQIRRDARTLEREGRL